MNLPTQMPPGPHHSCQKDCRRSRSQGKIWRGGLRPPSASEDTPTHLRHTRCRNNKDTSSATCSRSAHTRQPLDSRRPGPLVSSEHFHAESDAKIGGRSPSHTPTWPNLTGRRPLWHDHPRTLHNLLQTTIWLSQSMSSLHSRRLRGLHQARFPMYLALSATNRFHCGYLQNSITPTYGVSPSGAISWIVSRPTSQSAAPPARAREDRSRQADSISAILAVVQIALPPTF